MLEIYKFAMKTGANRNINPYKIAEIVGKKFGTGPCVKTIYNWIDKKWIPLRPEPPKDLLCDLYRGDKLSMGQIAKRLKTGKTIIKKYLRKYGVKIRSSIESQKLRLRQEGGKFGGYSRNKLTKRQKEFLIGTLLGDGTLYLGRRNTNARLKIEHSEKDSDYLEYKHSLIKNFVTGTIMRYGRFNKDTDKNYLSRTFITTTHPEFTKFHKLFYRGGKKVIGDTVLRMVTPFGLAIWIMDDGHYNKPGHFVDLYTMNFTAKEHLLIRKWFKNKFKINPNIEYHKQADKYYLRFNVSDTQKLVNIIRPYIISSMRRKIGAIRQFSLSAK